MNTPPQDKKYSLFIDTNIIQFSGSNIKEKSQSVFQVLEKLKKDGYNLVISEFTIFENLHGLSGRKAKEAAKLMQIYEKKEVSEFVLILAAQLGGLYHDEKFDGIDAGDKIIAASAILEEGHILTANHKDFPNPFFIQEEYIPTQYKINNYVQTIDIAVYKPNFELIIRRIQDNM